MKVVYVHVGLPRCASTLIENYFQIPHREIYNALRCTNILPLPRLYKELRRASSDLVWSDELCTRLRDYHLLPMLDHEAEAFFVSDESLSFVNNQIPEAPLVYPDRARFIPRLFDGFRPHVCLVVRNQASYIVSLYGLHLQNGGTMDFDSYIAAYPMKHLDWLTVAEAYADSVGMDNLTVLPFEKAAYATPGAIASDFLEAMQLAMGVKKTVALGSLPLVNPSLAPRYFPAKLAMNRATDPAAAAAAKAAIPEGNEAYLRRSAESPLSDEKTAEILDTFSAANEELFARFMPHLDGAFYQPGNLA